MLLPLLALLRKKPMASCRSEADETRWWHNWENDQFDELAAALVAGHLIECSTYVTGGYYSMFKDLMKQGKHLDMGFPIAEIESDGTVVITKEKNTGGTLSDLIP
jgi:hypothetical protein